LPALQILCLGLWFDLVGTLVNLAIAIAVAGAAERLRRFDSLGRIARWIGAATIAGLAVQLALSERR
jgi:threonine/homoserine/homoserine lactone efflux protein